MPDGRVALDAGSPTRRFGGHWVECLLPTGLLAWAPGSDILYQRPGNSAIHFLDPGGGDESVFMGDGYTPDEYRRTETDPSGIAAVREVLGTV